MYQWIYQIRLVHCHHPYYFIDLHQQRIVLRFRNQSREDQCSRSKTTAAGAGAGAGGTAAGEARTAAPRGTTPSITT